MFQEYFEKLRHADPSVRKDCVEKLIAAAEASSVQNTWESVVAQATEGLALEPPARTSFASVLFLLLKSQNCHLSVRQCLELGNRKLKVDSGDRNLQLGRASFLQTLARSSIWSSASFEDFQVFATSCFELLQIGDHLAEPAAQALYDAVTLGLSTSTVKRKLVISFIFDELTKRGIDVSAEGVALTLAASPAERRSLNKGSRWKYGDPLALANANTLAMTLHMSVANDPYKISTKSAAWNRQDARKRNNVSIHFVWKVIMQEFVQAASEPEERAAKRCKIEKADDDRQVDAAEFWTKAVDSVYFDQNASPTQLRIGIALLTSWLRAFADVEFVLTEKVMRLISSRSTNVFKMRAKITAALEDCAHHGHNGGIICRKLLTQPDFRSVLKFGAIQKILPYAVSDADELGSVFVDLLAKSHNVKNRQEIVDLIFILLKSVKGERTSWLQPIVKSLIEPAYFVSSYSEDEVQHFRQTIMSILTYTPRFKLDASTSLPYYALKTILSLQKKGAKPLVELDNELAESKKRIESTLKKIHKKRISSPHADSAQLQAFELLFCLVLQQLYAGNAEAASVLQELYECYSRACVQEDDNASTDPGEVITEILLSFISQQSNMVTRMCMNIWSAFSEMITPHALKLLYDILATDEGAEGHKQLFGSGDEENGDGNLTGDSDAFHSEDDGEDDNTKAHRGDNKIMFAETEKTDLELALTLGVTGPDDMDESMDDEQMAALDDRLSEIFHQRRIAEESRRNEKRYRSQNIIMMKTRALKLLSKYLEVQPTNLVGLSMAVPLLNTIKNSKNHRVQEFARELIKVPLCKKSQYSLTAKDVEGVKALLSEVQGMAAKSNGALFTHACDQFAVFCVKLLLNFDRGLIHDVSSIYATHLCDWFLSRRNKATSAMFIDLVNYLATKR